MEETKYVDASIDVANKAIEIMEKYNIEISEIDRVMKNSIDFILSKAKIRK